LTVFVHFLLSRAMPKPKDAIRDKLVRAALRKFGRSFEGDLIDNAKRFQLAGPAYKSMPPEQDGYFSIESAPQCAGPLAALHDPAVREVGIVGSKQVLKSIVGNLFLPYVMEHDPDDMAVFLENEEKCKAFAVRRVMSVIKAHPVLKARMESETDDRHDITRTKIILSSMTLTCAPLNESNVSTFTYRYIWISESWQHESDGLMYKAIGRSERFWDTRKILIESQAGMAKCDLHRWTQTAHRVPLTWLCPFCGGIQTWECGHELGNQRQRGFVPRQPFKMEPDWIAPKAGTFSGMKFAPAEKVEHGILRMLSIGERADTAKWECHHCAMLIADTPENRWAIARTYRQDYRVTRDGLSISPESVCFFLPREANPTNSFATTVKSYLSAKLAKTAGNLVPIQDWYMSERAIFYDENIDRVLLPAVTATIDPNVAIPNERFRTMLADAQKDIEASEREGKDRTGHLWWTAEAVDIAGNTFQIGRGYVTSWKDFVATYKRLKIPVENVLVDGRYCIDEVREQAALNREVKPVIDRGVKKNAIMTWKMLAGSSRNRWHHERDGLWRVYSEPDPKPVSVRLPDGQWLHLTVPWIEWSNLHITNQLALLRKGLPDKPRFVALPADSELLTTHTRAKEKERGEDWDRSYDGQMNAQVLGTEKNKPKWIDLHKEQHYPDCAKMGIVIKSMAGLLGAVAAPEASASEAQ
jgi:hypothetical protein